MELKLTKQHHEYLMTYTLQPISCEAMREHIVPDSLSDIARIVDTFCHVTVTGKDVGIDGRLSITGSVDVSVLYIPEKGIGPSVLRFTLPFQCGSDSSCGADAQFVNIACELQNLDTRILNPRKVLTRVNVMFYPQYRRQKSFTVGTEVQEREDLQLLHCSKKTKLLAGVKEKEFSVMEEFSVPGGRSMEEILNCRCIVRGTDCKLIGTKLVLKGNLLASLLYRSSDGTVQSSFTEFPFSQILDGGGLQEDWEFECEYQTVSFDCRVGSEGNPDDHHTATLSAMLRSCVTAYHIEDISFIADMYGTGCSVHCDTEELELNEDHNRYVKRVNIREILETATPVKTVLNTEVRCGLSRMDPSSMQLEIPVWANCLYLDEEDSLHSVRRDFTVKCQMDHEPHLICECKVQCSGDVLTGLVPDGIEVRCPVECQLDVHKRSLYISVSGGEIEDGVTHGPTPSLVLRKIGEEETLWSVAKAYRTTVQSILAVNDLQEEGQISNNKPLLIPCRG